MCGIVGIFKFREGGVEITEPLLKRMRDTMVHRGPDGAGLWRSSDGRVGLAHRRLSIIDLSEAGAQPMAGADGALWITYNGEVYNHAELRTELEAEGYRYRSRTDTETLLYAYDRWGLECVHRLQGMFAFGLWDARKRRLWLVRDRIGIKPLYYTFVGGQVLFASEIKALLEHPQVSRDVEPTALYHYMTLYTAPAPLTMFKGIYKLPAGHAMVVEEGRDPRVYHYWDPIVPRERFERTFRGSGEPGVEAYCTKEIRRLLSESIEKRMMSDVPFGVFLSGGVDSSTNVALMARLMDRPVDTYTVAFKNNPQYNELEYARRIAREFKTNHHEVLIDERDLLEYLPDLIYHQDEPIADPVCVPLYYVSKLARDNGTTVIQVGEGSDEQFCGYPWNVIFQRIHEGPWKWFRRLPRAMRVPAAHMALLASRSHWTGRRWMPAFGAELAMRAAYDQELFWGGAIAFLETVKQRYVNKDAFGNGVTVPYFQGMGDSFLGNHQHLSSATVVGALADHLRREKPEADFLEHMIYMELKHRLPELLLMRVDKITMSTSVEARVPFLDHALVEFTMNIPPALKIHHGETKHILKKAVEGLIPRDIIYRRKQGFAAPVDAWMDTELGREMRNTFQTTRFRRRGLLRFDRVDAEMKGPSSRRASSAYWILFNFLKWYDRWIEGCA